MVGMNRSGWMPPCCGPVKCSITYLINFCRYYGLQLWFPEYFKKLREETCKLEATASTCANATDLQYYQDTLYTAIASLPGNIAGALLINIIGGKVQLGTYCFMYSCVPSTSRTVCGASLWSILIGDHALYAIFTQDRKTWRDKNFCQWEQVAKSFS